MSEHEDAQERQPTKPTKPTPHPRSHPQDTEDSHDTDAGSGRRPRLGRASARVAVALVSVLALLATGYGYTVVSDLQGSVHTTDALGELENAPESDAPPEDDGAINILLVGTDARTDMQNNPLPRRMLKLLRTESSTGLNTDTLILLRVPENGDDPTVISIPRDTWVQAPSGGKKKINAVFGLAKAATSRKLEADGMSDPAKLARESDQAGRKALIKTVQRFTQVHIDHYAEVNLLGFYLLAKTLGGVTVCLKAPTEDKDSGADFEAGVQQLSAAEALSFVRQRKNIPGNGFSRIRRQQAFLATALHKVLSADTLSDRDKLDDLSDAVHRSMVLDPDLELLELADQVRGIASGDVSFVTIPVITLNGRSPDGLSIVKVDRAEVREFIDGTVENSGPTTTSRSGGGGAAGTSGRTSTAADVPCVY